MKNCNCCNVASEKVMTYTLPAIGYGSVFDCCEETKNITYFNLCPDCAKMINQWLKYNYPYINIEEFWKCEIYKTQNEAGHIIFEEFRYEDILIKLFIKFMPEVYFGKNYRIRKIRYYLKSILGR